MRELAGKSRQRPIGQHVVLAATGATLAVLLSVGVVVLPDEPTPGAPPASTPSVHPVLLAERSRAEDLRRRLERIEADETTAARSRTARLDAIGKALAMPGVIVKRRPEAVEVYFRNGLFIRELQLTSAGADLLADVGHRLAKLDVSITVVGHSVAVPGGRTSGGSGTALDRAQVAAERLADAAHLPLTAFTLRTAEQRQRPSTQDAGNPYGQPDPHPPGSTEGPRKGSPRWSARCGVCRSRPSRRGRTTRRPSRSPTPHCLASAT